MHTYEPKAYHNQSKSVPQQIAPHMSKPAVDTESGNHNYKSYKAEKIMQKNPYSKFNILNRIN